VRSIWFWAGVFPIACIAAILVLAFVSPRWCWIPALGFLLYPLLALKVARSQHSRGTRAWDALLYGLFVVVGKFPQLFGMLKYRSAHRRGTRNSLIEYKSGSRMSPATK
jgi:hypothetical protein